MAKTHTDRHGNVWRKRADGKWWRWFQHDDLDYIRYCDKVLQLSPSGRVVYAPDSYWATLVDRVREYA